MIKKANIGFNNTFISIYKEYKKLGSTIYILEVNKKI